MVQKSRIGFDKAGVGLFTAKHLGAWQPFAYDKDSLVYSDQSESRSNTISMFAGFWVKQWMASRTGLIKLRTRLHLEEGLWTRSGTFRLNCCSTGYTIDPPYIEGDIERMGGTMREKTNATFMVSTSSEIPTELESRMFLKIATSRNVQKREEICESYSTKIVFRWTTGVLHLVNWTTHSSLACFPFWSMICHIFWERIRPTQAVYRYFATYSISLQNIRPRLSPLFCPAICAWLKSQGFCGH